MNCIFNTCNLSGFRSSDRRMFNNGNIIKHKPGYGNVADSHLIYAWIMKY